jgi:hypothetical protein
VNTNSAVVQFRGAGPRRRDVDDRAIDEFAGGLLTSECLDPAQFHAEGEVWIADAKLAGTAAAFEQAALGGQPVATPNGGRQTFAILRDLDAPWPTPTRCSAQLPRPPSPNTRSATQSQAAPTRVPSPALSSPLRPSGPPRPTARRPSRRLRLCDARQLSQLERLRSRHTAGPLPLTRPEREAGLRVATAPMIREPDELESKVDKRSGLRFYRIQPADRERTRARVERSSRPGSTRARARCSPSAQGPPIHLSHADLELWGLTDRLTAPIDEDLSRGERLCVMKAGGTRLAILRERRGDDRADRDALDRSRHRGRARGRRRRSRHADRFGFGRDDVAAPQLAPTPQLHLTVD